MEKGLIVHALVFNKVGEVLLIKRSKKEDVLPGFWDIPGGTLEDGEDPEAGAIRETLEETGLKVKNLQLFQYTSNVDREKNKQFVRLIFRGESESSNVRLNTEDHAEYRWISPCYISADMELVEYLHQIFDEVKKWQEKFGFSDKSE